MLKAIACISKNRAIGKDGQLIFDILEDKKFFKNTTVGHTVVMGTKTFDSIGTPLSDRKNIIVTHNVKEYQEQLAHYSNCYPTSDIDFIINLAKTQDVFIIGGGEIYKLFLPYIEELFLTIVNTNIYDGDTFFPEYEDKFEFVESTKIFHHTLSKYGTVEWSIQTWKAKSKSTFDKQDITELLMNSAEAMDALFNGTDIKLPSWAGYWHYNKETGVVEMHCKDGKVIDIRQTDRIEYTLKNIASNNWVVATSANTPILGGEAWMTYGEALGYIKRGLLVQSEYMHEKTYLKEIEADIINDGKVLGTEKHIATFNKDGYVGYYSPTQLDINSKWRFYKGE